MSIQHQEWNNIKQLSHDVKTEDGSDRILLLPVKFYFS